MTTELELASKPRRNWKGRFIRKLTPTPEGVRCWLIWSKKWGRWHRRSESGGANGYTSDIAQAGLFPFSKASEYHDGYDNEAWHVNDKIVQIQQAIAQHDAISVLLKAKAQAIQGKE